MNTDLKEQYIHALYEQKAFMIREEPFTLHHGGTSHFFMNHSTFLSHFSNFELLMNIYMSLIPQDLTDYRLAAVDSVMSPVFTGYLAASLKKDIILTKEKKMEHGVEQKVYGDASGEVILIDDVSSTGTILINAAKVLREKGAIVRYAIFSASRDNTAIENLKRENIEAFYITTYENIAQTLWSTLKAEEKSIIRQEIQEKGYNWNLPAN